VWAKFSRWEDWSNWAGTVKANLAAYTFQGQHVMEAKRSEMRWVASFRMQKAIVDPTIWNQ
jgi:hypothetical protein